MANQKGGISLDMGNQNIMSKDCQKCYCRNNRIIEQKPKNLNKWIKIEDMKRVNLNIGCFALHCSIDHGGIIRAFFNSCLKATKEFDFF